MAIDQLGVEAARRLLRARLGAASAFLPRGDEENTLESPLEAAAAQLEQLLARTVRFGDSQSGLLLTSAGGGARAAVSSALRRLRDQFGAFSTVYLNGVVLQNELEAFKEMAAQLAKSRAVKLPVMSYWNMYEDLRALVVAADEPVIVVLDHFEQFAVASNNAKQMLLYNLLDWLQAKDVHMGVLGITTDFNVVDNLEKRVRSRFSNLQIVIDRPTFAHVLRLLASHLTLPACDSEDEDYNLLNLDTEFVTAFNARVEELLLSSSPKSALQTRLEFDFDIGKPLEFFLRMTSTAVGFLSVEEPLLSLSHFSKAKQALEPDHQLAVLQTISENALALLVGMSHLEKQGQRVVTLEMVYKRWEQFYRSHDMLAQMPTRAEAQRALEHLVGLQLADDAGDAFRIGRVSKQAANDALQPEYRAVYSNVPPRSLDGMIRNRSIKCSTILTEWSIHGGGATAV